MSAKGLFINSAQNGFTVKGANNVLFPDNGVLFFPFNSVIAVVDEGDIATFRSAYNNDVLFSGLIENITIDGNPVSKEDVVDIFANVANQEGGGGGGDTSGLFAGASYDSSTKHINFYNDNDELLTYIDATAFIKDGMVDTVAIQNGNLVITFNTDAGKQPISIPLTDIFNPNNYYTKSQVDTALSAKANSADLSTVATSGDYDDLTNKPTIPAAQVNADWNASSGVAQILNKPTNVSAFTNDAGYLTQHQSLSNYYTKSETDAELADKQDVLTAGTGITIDANNVISATGGGGGDYVDVPTFNQKEVAIAQALTDLNENKADKTELPDTSTFATKTELNAKQDTLTAGTGISIQNNVISATGGGGGDYQFYSETDEEQEEGTTINRHKDAVIEIADEGGTTNSGMGTFFTQVEEDGSISYTDVSSSMYANKEDGTTVQTGSIVAGNNYASITVNEDGEDNGTEYSKYTDFVVNSDGFTVEINEDGNTAASIGFNKNLGLYKHNIDAVRDEPFVTSVGSIERIVTVTQSDYDAMAENDDIDPNTLYIIVSNI